MSQPIPDPNVLFGLLALENYFLSQEDLVAVMTVWEQDRTRPLEQILLERKVLTVDEVQALQVLMEHYLRRHEEDVSQRLQTLHTLGSAQQHPCGKSSAITTIPLSDGWPPVCCTSMRRIMLKCWRVWSWTPIRNSLYWVELYCHNLFLTDQVLHVLEP